MLFYVKCKTTVITVFLLTYNAIIVILILIFSGGIYHGYQDF